MREILEINCLNTRLVGTYHSAPVDETRSPALGLLFFNSGFLPRSPVGDLTTRLSDHFAELGLPSFRFDMPGLGDSEGDLSADVETFFSQVLAGAHGEIAARLSAELVRRYRLQGLVLAGLCGGAVTSVYAAAARSSNSAIAGLALLDPSFKLITPAPRPGSKPADSTSAKKTNSSNATLESWRVKVLSTAAGQHAKRLYRASAKPVILSVRRAVRRIRGEPLPKEANMVFIDAMKGVASRGLPMLVLMAGAEEDRTEKFDYLRHISNGLGRNFLYRYLPETTHSFVEGDGESIVTRNLQQWLGTVNPGLGARFADSAETPVAK
jgi:pimeloyl-ACP methyl ester carboxylesterase